MLSKFYGKNYYVHNNGDFIFPKIKLGRKFFHMKRLKFDNILFIQNFYFDKITNRKFLV